MSTRTEHLQWCKERAIEYVDQWDMVQAFSSFHSDMSRHPETQDHPALPLSIQLFASGHLATTREMRDWINGFN